MSLQSYILSHSSCNICTSPLLFRYALKQLQHGHMFKFTYFSLLFSKLLKLNVNSNVKKK